MSSIPDEPAARGGLWEENVSLARRYLELEQSSREEIGKLKTANETLMKGDSQVKRLLDTAAVGFVLLDNDLRIANANRTVCGLLNHSFDEISGADFRQFVYVGRLGAFAEMIGRLDASDEVQERLDLVDRDGKVLPCRATATPLRGDSGGRGGTFLLLSDISEQERLLEEVKAMTLEVREAAEARETFLSIVSRELKTPVSGILGMSEILLEGGLDPARRELASVIRTSAGALFRLVEDVSEMSSLDTSAEKALSVPFSPRRLADCVVGLFRDRADEKGLDLAANVSSKVPPLAMGDPPRLRRILVNLMDNAVKYTVRGGATLSADVIGGSLRFLVSDTGPGISPEAGKDLFTVFSSAAPALSRRFGGLGLGLYICRRNAELMGGKIGYETEPGHGSAFHLVLPLTAAPPGAEEEPVRRGSGSVRPPPLRILLAEDNELNQLAVKAFLQNDGHDVSVVGNGVEAAEAAEKTPFDAVLMDITMPKLDGVQAMRLIRERERGTGRRTRIIAMAPARPGPGGDYRALGMDGEVRKPVRPRELSAAVAAAVGFGEGAGGEGEIPPPSSYDADATGGLIRRIDSMLFLSRRRAMDHPQFIGILRIFLEDALPHVLRLADLAGREPPDLERMVFTARKVRPAAEFFGFVSLADFLARVEAACRENPVPARLGEIADEAAMISDDTLEELRRIHPDVFSTLSGRSGGGRDSPEGTPPQ